MALMQLLAYGDENRHITTTPMYATGYNTHIFNGNSLRMTRTCDVAIPEFLEFEMRNEVNLEEFKNLTNNVLFELRIGGTVIFTIPIRFMSQLKEPELCDNKFYVTIPFKMFCDDIKLVALQHHYVDFELKNTENMFNSCSITFLEIFHDSEERQRLAQTPQETIIQVLNRLEINANTNNVNFNVNFDGIHKGFFIECNDVDEINNILIKFNGSDRLNYNRHLTRTKCVKISQKLIYLPLNFEKSYLDKTPVGFEGSVNLSRIDHMVVNIRFDTIQQNICFYGLGSNLLRNMSGMAGVAYYYDNLPTEISQPLINSSIFQVTPILHQPSNTINKKIEDEEKQFCAITFENIGENENYMNCVGCNNNFFEDALKLWLSQRTHINKTCPTCRHLWNDYTVYVNKTEDLLMIEN